MGFQTKLMHFEKSAEKPGFFVYRTQRRTPSIESHPTTESPEQQKPRRQVNHRQRRNEQAKLRQKEMIEQELDLKFAELLEEEDLEKIGKKWGKFKKEAEKYGYTSSSFNERKEMQAGNPALKYYHDFSLPYQERTREILENMNPEEREDLFTSWKFRGVEKIKFPDGMSHIKAHEIFDPSQHPYIQKDDTIYYYNTGKNQYYDASGLQPLALHNGDKIKIGDDIQDHPELKNYLEGVVVTKNLFDVSRNSEGETTINIQEDGKKIIEQAIEKLRNLPTKEERQAEFIRITNIILQATNELIDEQGCSLEHMETCGDEQKKIDHNRKAVALFLGEFLSRPENQRLKSELFILPPKDGYFTFNPLHSVIESDLLLGSLFKTNIIYIKQETAKGVWEEVIAFRSEHNGTSDFHYVKDGKIQKIKAVKGTEFRLAPHDSPVPKELAQYVTHYDQKQVKKHYQENMQNDSYRFLLQHQSLTVSEQQLVSKKEIVFYEQIEQKFHQEQSSSAVQPEKNQLTEHGLEPLYPIKIEEKQAIANNIQGMDVPPKQVLGMNPNGTYKIQLENSPATINYDTEDDVIEIETGAEDNVLTFPNDEQSSTAIELIAELAYYGNSDILDAKKVNSPDIQNLTSQFANKMNDLFPSESANYFDSEHASEIANTLFHMGGKSFFEIVTNLQIVDEETGRTEELVNNDQNTSALNRMDLKPNSFSKNRYAIQNFLYNIGERSIKTNDLLRSQEANGGKIVINKQGQIV